MSDTSQTSSDSASSGQMFCLLSTQGTAMAESALCAVHVADVEHRALAVQRAGRYSQMLQRSTAGVLDDDWDQSIEFTDCTGNDELACIVCGARTP